MSPVEPVRPSAPAEETCAIEGCHETSHRTIATKEAQKAFPALPESRKTHLCKEHYKAWKKATKKDRTLERLDW